MNIQICKIFLLATTPQDSAAAPSRCDSPGQSPTVYFAHSWCQAFLISSFSPSIRSFPPAADSPPPGCSAVNRHRLPYLPRRNREIVRSKALPRQVSHSHHRIGSLGLWLMKPCLTESLFMRMSLVHCNFKADMLSHGIGCFFAPDMSCSKWKNITW